MKPLGLSLLIALLAGDLPRSADFTREDWLERFAPAGPPPWTEGLERTSRVHDSERKKTVLEVAYPKGEYGNDRTGAQWPAYLGGKHERLRLTYFVRVAEGFDFVRGGKLPGLMGGHRKGHPHSNLTGGNKPDGTDGWSARIMWRGEGRLVQYVYHRHQPGKWGEDFEWKVDGAPARLVPGRWHKLTTLVSMNTVGRRDGCIVSWLDDVKAMERCDLEFRTVPELGIDALYFSTFFGGDGPSWAARKNETIRFDAFRIESE